MSNATQKKRKKNETKQTEETCMRLRARWGHPRVMRLSSMGDGGVRACVGCSGRRDLKFVFGPFGVPFLENQTHTQRESAPVYGALLNQKKIKI